MTAQILTIAQQKGGVGKTTLVAHLAAAFALAGVDTATIDIDPQASLSQWAALRSKISSPPLTITHHSLAGWRLETGLEKLKTQHQLILIDSAPHALTEARIAMRQAHLVLLPLQPSALDLWACRASLAAALEEHKGQILAVLNRVPARLKGRDLLAADLAQWPYEMCPATPGRFKLLPHLIGNRSAFANVMGRGLTVIESERTSLGAQEILRLAEGIASFLSLTWPVDLRQ
jgi:chromosome partitioning protein